MRLQRHSRQDTEAYRLGAATMLLALATVLVALGFQYIGGYNPCPLCLQERYAYYAGVPAAFAGLILISAGAPRVAAIVFAVVAAGFLVNTGLGVYHAGAEWKFWPGPASCGGAPGPVARSAADLLKGIATERVIRCDEAPWTFLGLSFAGWNAVTSLALAAMAGAVSGRLWNRLAG